MSGVCINTSSAHFCIQSKYSTTSNFFHDFIYVMLCTKANRRTIFTCMNFFYFASISDGSVKKNYKPYSLSYTINCICVF